MSQRNNNVMTHVQKLTTGETIKEPAREIPVFAKCDILVVGGGPAGCAAASSAAKLGADVILVERYGHLGGMSTGGQSLWMYRQSDWEGKQIITGYANDVLGRMPAGSIGGIPKDKIGSQDPELVSFWEKRSGAYHGMLTWSPVIDPEMLKISYSDLLLERGAKLLLHSWAVAISYKDRVIDGVIFESKSGRYAINAKVVVDATGDGDIANFTGSEYASDIIENHIHCGLNTAFRWGGVDYNKYANFWSTNRKEFNEIMTGAQEIAGSPARPSASPRNDVAFSMGPRFYGYDCTDIWDLTEVEVHSRKIILKLKDFFSKNLPGFEDAWILDTAPQIGVRHSRRIACDKTVTTKGWNSGVVFDDEIGICPPPRPGYKNISVPLGCIVPKNMDNLLVPGRALSCDVESHEPLRQIPICWLMGQGAGIAAALAVKAGNSIRSVDYQKIRDNLKEQGAQLSR